MKNCLSDCRFANLLFVNVQIGDAEVTALFDTGAGMTVIAQSLLHRLRAAPEKEVLCIGNNNGVVRGLQTAVIPNIRLGDVCMENCKVLVTDDADFALSDESGSVFPAEVLLGCSFQRKKRTEINETKTIDRYAFRPLPYGACSISDCLRSRLLCRQPHSRGRLLPIGH